ncbi:MAG: XisH family protein [Thermoflexibacter sp.]|jgi:hypothetical protein|nr:XisH family protein [Thermoflexibacter sp.]
MAKDIFHEVVKTALSKDGWTITHDPYRILALGKDVQVDLGAEKPIIAAEKGMERIAVEVKSFINPSFTYDFHLALGQYLNYLLLIEEQEPERELYLAVSEEIYETHFHNLAIQKAINRYQIKIVVFDPTNLIKQWIK